MSMNGFHLGFGACRNAIIGLATATIFAIATQVNPIAANAAGSAQSFIARIDGGPASARVGIIVQNGKWKAYVCSLDDAFNLSSARWYEGEVGPDGLVQGMSPDGVQFTGRVSAEAFTGRLVNTDKQTLAFNGKIINASSRVGLYRGEASLAGQKIVIGAVIGEDGSFASTTQFAGEIRFVTPVDPRPLFMSGNRVLVRLGEKRQGFIARLVTSLE